jgi:hypothetical protein
MPGTMWGHAGYPSLGYRLGHADRREQRENRAKGSVVAGLTRRLEARTDRRAIGSCFGYGEEPHHLVAFPSTAHRAIHGWMKKYDGKPSGDMRSSRRVAVYPISGYHCLPYSRRHCMHCQCKECAAILTPPDPRRPQVYRPGRLWPMHAREHELGTTKIHARW